MWGYTDLQMACKSEFVAYPDKPLGRIVLVPFDGITIVHRELMVEVVVAFANGGKGSDDVVARSVFVIEGSISEPVGE
jgi:hypothetical protein